MLTAPDWGHWGQMGKAELWQAVALSAGIEPRKTEHFRLNGRTVNEYTHQRTRDDQERTKCELYQSRIDIALSCLGGDLAALSGTRSDASVSLAVFARWATSKGWPLPAAMAAMVETSAPCAVASQPIKTPPGKQHRTKRRTVLLDAEIAMAQSTATDRTDPTSVWNELVKLAEKRFEGKRVGCLLGLDEQAIKYSDGEHVRHFQKRSLHARMKRAQTH